MKKKSLEEKINKWIQKQQEIFDDSSGINYLFLIQAKLSNRAQYSLIFVRYSLK